MKRQWHKVIILAMTFILVMSLCSCDLLSWGGKNNSTNEKKVAKPEFSIAMANYETLDAKKSEFEGKVVITFYGKSTFTAGQAVSLTRIQNGNKTYIDGSIKSCDLDNIDSIINPLIAILPLNIKDKAENVKGYLNGTNSAEFLFGHDSVTSSYNFKGNLKKADKTDAVYYATNDEFINNKLQEISINSNLKLSDYLMFSTFVNFSKDGGWIGGDEASAFYDNVSALSNYQMSASNEKIYNYVLDTIENFIGSLDITKYESDIKRYNEYIGMIKSWITLDNSTVNASVDKNNLPVKMNTTTRVNININTAQFIDIITEICDLDTAKELFFLNYILSMFKGTNNEENTLGISLDITMDETFRYDEENINLDVVDQDLFLDAKVEKAKRVSYIVREEPAVDTENAEQDTDD